MPLDGERGPRDGLDSADLASMQDDLAQVTALATATRLPLIRWHDLRLRASVAALLGHFDEGQDLNEQARRLAADALAQDVSALAGTLVERGATGDLERAGVLARQALDEGRRLGMPGPVGQAVALLDRIRAATRSADPLSGREREVAAMVAEALTNRQIAERLFLSERTVESHVRNILAKLGLANRTEIATALSPSRALPPQAGYARPAPHVELRP